MSPPLPQHRTAPHLTTTTTTTASAAAVDNIFPDNLGSGLGWAGLGWLGMLGSTPPPVPIRLLGYTSCRGITRARVTLGCDEAPLVTRLTIHTAAITRHAGCDHGVTARSIRACALAAHCQVCRVQGPPRAARSSSALPASEGGGPAAVKAGHRCLNTSHRISTYLDI